MRLAIGAMEDEVIENVGFREEAQLLRATPTEKATEADVLGDEIEDPLDDIVGVAKPPHPRLR